MLNKEINNKKSFSTVKHKNLNFFQPKLSINQPNDTYEQEADAIADKVMRMPHFSVNNNLFFKPAISSVQRKCAHCEEEEKQLHRKEVNTKETVADGSTENYISSLNGKGKPLTQPERSFFEPRFGYDFSNVQLHTNAEANQSAKSINALAYTNGNHVVFGADQYQPGTESGKKLMAHELTHVVQQNENIHRQNEEDAMAETSSAHGIEIYNSSSEAAGSPDAESGGNSSDDLQQTTAACPVTAVFSSTLAGSEKQNCQPPANTHGVSKLARFRLTGVATGTTAALSEQFKMLEDTHGLFSKLVPNSFTTATGIFDDCYMVASKDVLPPDFRLKVMQNHLLNGVEISKNEITYAAQGVSFCTHKRMPASCDFGARCSLA